MKTAVVISILVCLCLAAVPLYGYDIDTTRVRTALAPPEKPLGSKLLSGPSLLLRLPFYIPEAIARGLVHVTYDEPEVLRTIVKLFLADLAVYPMVDYGGNSGLGAGIGFRAQNVSSLDDKLFVEGRYSVYKYEMYQAGYEAPRMFGDQGGLEIIGRYDRMPREFFFGVGNASDYDDEVSIGMERASLQAGIVYRPDFDWSLGIYGGYWSHNLFDGDDEDFTHDLDAVGRQLDLTDSDFRSARYLRFGSTITFDWRNRPGQTTAGGIESLTLEYVTGVDISDDIEYTRVNAEIRQYLHLFLKRIIELRLEVQTIDLIDPESQPQLPYYLLSELGDKRHLAGFRPHRFYDYDFAFASIEYRYPVWTTVDALIFLDGGRVYRAITESAVFDDWYASYGFGFRAWGDWGEVFRVIFAFSKEEFRFSVGVRLP